MQRPQKRYSYKAFCAASGSRNIANYEQHLARGRLPPASSIQYEGTFYKFMFETGLEQEKLFAPVFSVAFSKDPFSGQQEYFLCMGMNSKLDGDGLEKHNRGRPNLNLVIILDVSGSMNCAFGEGDTVDKLEVAKTSLINGLLPQLHTNDRLALATFTESSRVVQPMCSVSQLDPTALKQKIAELRAGGGTALVVGMKEAASQLESIAKKNGDGNENRIFYFTDMDPGTAKAECKELFSLTERLASEKTAFVTFVGIGVDFNTQVVDEIAKIKGCSYLAVKHSREFAKLMDEEFKFFVTLAAQDVHVKLVNENSAGWQVEKVFGSPGNSHPTASEAEGAKGKETTLCKISSVFPSPKASPTQTKGGVVIVKLKPTSANPPTKLTAVCSYCDKSGKKFSETYVIDLPLLGNDSSSLRHPEFFFGGSAVRKAVMLVRYVKFTKRVLRDAAKKNGIPSFDLSSGLFGAKSNAADNSAKKGKASLDERYADLFDRMIEYFSAEAEMVNDPLLIDLQKSMEELRGNGLDDKKKKPTTNAPAGIFRGPTPSYIV